MTNHHHLASVIAAVFAFGLVAGEATATDRRKDGDKLERQMQGCSTQARKLDRMSSTRDFKQVESCLNRAFAGYDKFFGQIGGTQAGGAAGSNDVLLFEIEKAQSFRFFCRDMEQGQLGEIFMDGFESGNVSAWSSSRGEWYGTCDKWTKP